MNLMKESLPMPEAPPITPSKTATEEKPIKLFISYSHDSDEHADRVLALANQLRVDGYNCQLDQYETAPAQGWTQWMSDGIESAAF